MLVATRPHPKMYVSLQLVPNMQVKVGNPEAPVARRFVCRVSVEIACVDGTNHVTPTSHKKAEPPRSAARSARSSRATAAGRRRKRHNARAIRCASRPRHFRRSRGLASRPADRRRSCIPVSASPAPGRRRLAADATLPVSVVAHSRAADGGLWDDPRGSIKRPSQAGASRQHGSTRRRRRAVRRARRAYLNSCFAAAVIAPAQRQPRAPRAESSPVPTARPYPEKSLPVSRARVLPKRLQRKP